MKPVRGDTRRLPSPSDADARDAPTTAPVPSIVPIISQLLDASERVMPGDFRFVPTSFDPDDIDLRAYPVHPDRPWVSLQRLLADESTRGVLSRLPPFWQANFSIFDASRTFGVPLFASDPENIPLASVALRTTGIDTLVTTRADAATFLQYLSEQSVPHPRSILAIDKVNDIPARIFTNAHVRHEVHLMPGVTILDQCGGLSERTDVMFHVNEQIDVTGLSPFTFSVTRAGPIPLKNICTTYMLRARSTCSCGRTTYEL